MEPIPHATGDDSCDHVVGHLYEYLDSEMTPEDAERMRAHLAHCSPCLAELGLDELVRQVLRRSCADKAPEGLRARVRAQLTVTRTTTVTTLSAGEAPLL
nr:mycothiol system anti-sigma-R factor [Luteimicrobium subarcticum]